jgi:inosine-uridine nucleoside N-ribohydrolase
VRKVHLDTDLGGDIDDLCALAMLLKWPDTEVDGITTVTDDNGKRAGFVKYALRLAGKDKIPVKAGADVAGGYYRIKCGWQDERYWPATIIPAENPVDGALELLKNSIENDATVICIGPLTNLYLLEKKFPGILEKAKIFLMGGYVYPPREGYPQWKQNLDFNIQVDIRSAKHVLESSSPTLIPVTVTVETFLRKLDLKNLSRADDLSKLIAKQAEIFAGDEKYDQKYGRTCEKLPDDIVNFLHDPLAVAVALGWMEGIEIKEIPLSFTVKDTWLNESVDVSGRSYRLVTKIDGKRFGQFWLDMVTA